MPQFHDIILGTLHLNSSPLCNECHSAAITIAPWVKPANPTPDSHRAGAASRWLAAPANVVTGVLGIFTVSFSALDNFAATNIFAT